MRRFLIVLCCVLALSACQTTGKFLKNEYVDSSYKSFNFTWSGGVKIKVFYKAYEDSKFLVFCARYEGGQGVYDMAMDAFMAQNNIILAGDNIGAATMIGGAKMASCYKTKVRYRLEHEYGSSLKFDGSGSVSLVL